MMTVTTTVMMKIVKCLMTWCFLCSMNLQENKHVNTLTYCLFDHNNVAEHKKVKSSANCLLYVNILANKCPRVVRSLKYQVWMSY